MEAAFNGIFRIAEFILAFGLLVFLHELGHYLAAKFFNIQVEEFGFGFPPRLVKLFQFRETEFTLNWLPFGAFVRPKGENDPNVPGGLAAASPFPRLVVLFAGSTMNLITGVLLFTLLYGIYGVPEPNRVLIDNVVTGSPAAAAGLLPGDVILAVNGQTIGSNSTLQQVVGQNLDQEITLTYERGGQQMQTSLVPRAKPPEGQGPLGIVMGVAFRKVGSSEWFPRAVETTYNQIALMITLPVKMIQGEVSSEEGRFVGPVGIFNVFDAARDQDIEMAAEPNQPAGINTLSLLAMLSIALGITNLLPIPALDGGRILFVLPEILLRRRVPARYENLIHLIGFAALILLMIYVTTQDIINPINFR
jgi:regulator of sigma E protease